MRGWIRLAFFPIIALLSTSTHAAATEQIREKVVELNADEEEMDLSVRIIKETTDSRCGVRRGDWLHITLRVYGRPCPFVACLSFICLLLLFLSGAAPGVPIPQDLSEVGCVLHSCRFVANHNKRLGRRSWDC